MDGISARAANSIVARYSDAALVSKNITEFAAGGIQDARSRPTLRQSPQCGRSAPVAAGRTRCASQYCVQCGALLFVEPSTR